MPPNNHKKSLFVLNNEMVIQNLVVIFDAKKVFESIPTPSQNDLEKYITVSTSEMFIKF